MKDFYNFKKFKGKNMPYSWKALAFGVSTVIIVMLALQMVIKITGFEINTLIMGAIAGMAGAYVLGQINDKDKK